MFAGGGEYKGQRRCAVHDDGTRPVHGRNDTRLNDLNSHTNDEPVEHVISSAVCLPMEAIDEIKARHGFKGNEGCGPGGNSASSHNFKRLEAEKGGRNTLLQKDKVTHVSLWLKMHNVPIVAYSKVGLDLISAKVGRLMRLDAHTNFICLNSWGRSDYARALVEKLIGCDKNVASNTGQSLDTTKKPSPSDSSMNGMSSFINDDISLEELRNFVDKSMQEESVLEQVGNYDINGCTSREKQGEKVSSKKSSSSLEILNEDSDTDVDEVFVPKVRTTFPSSSGGAGQINWQKGGI
ncbi:hypothetical protein Tco_0799587 [Tanacetum coccineum]|uniref:Uncharacterized protein n=1 Tax=Tanacetum coccineum TaxID=301880 RepID=A0ABQ4ZQQ6_9ASTR